MRTRFKRLPSAFKAEFAVASLHNEYIQDRYRKIFLDAANLWDHPQEKIGWTCRRWQNHLDFFCRAPLGSLTLERKTSYNLSGSLRDAEHHLWPQSITDLISPTVPMRKLLCTLLLHGLEDSFKKPEVRPSNLTQSFPCPTCTSSPSPYLFTSCMQTKSACDSSTSLRISGHRYSHSRVSFGA